MKEFLNVMKELSIDFIKSSDVVPTTPEPYKSGLA